MATTIAQPPPTEHTAIPQLKKKVSPVDVSVMSNGVESRDGSEPTTPTNAAPDRDEHAEIGKDVGPHPENNGDDECEVVPIGSVDSQGQVIDKDGNVVGKVEGHVPEGSLVDTEGDVLDAEGNIIGKATIDIGEAAEAVESGAKDIAKSGNEVEQPELAGPFGVQDNGEVTNAVGIPVGQLADGNPQDLVDRSIKEIDEQGNLKAESGYTLGKVDLIPEVPKDDDYTAQDGSDKAPTVAGDQLAADLDDKIPEGEDAAAGSQLAVDLDDKIPEGEDVASNLEDAKHDLDLSILDGLKVNKMGKIVKEDGTPIGQIVEGDPKKLIGKKVDAEGKIWNDAGKVIGRAEPLQDAVEGALTAPFEDFPDATISANGDVIFEGRIVGKVIDGDPKKLEGKKIDADGDILDKHGNILGKAERYQEEDPELEPEPEAADLSSLEGKKVNKAGNIVDDNGKLFGRVLTGDLAKLIGRKCDAEGKIYSDSGKVIGTAELVSVDDRDEGYSGLFEDFPDAVVDAKGNVVFEGQVVGKLIEGDAKKLAGKKIDKDGEVVDKIGNVLGKAERWTEPDEPEAEVIDMSALAGKRVNKLGNVVDSNGQIYGRVVSGDPKKLAGKMCDKNGNIMNEMGDIIGKAELVPEAERDGEKTGPFADFDNPTVTKEGKVVDAKGTIIGRLAGGDAKILFGKLVDSDGDILDKNGNTLGRAERWEEEEKEIPKHAAFGRKVNKKGDVVDENGDVIAKLTSGDILNCAGKEIDNDGDVKDQKGTVVGHITLIEDIPEPEVVEEPEAVEEPKETEEEAAKRTQLEQDRKLAGQLGSLVEQSIEKIKPILKMITDTIDAAERQPKDERDEQKLVDTVKPLLEEGGQILQECNGAIRALDPDGRIQTNAKHKTASRDATPEEYRLADQLKELTGTVMTTIDSAKKKIAGMPHAKKQLNPLWGLLAEPLGQIIAAVGLLLSGVLGLVGKLLGALGLGGLLDNLLGGLGIKGILEGLGLGMVTKSLTGKK